MGIKINRAHLKRMLAVQDGKRAADAAEIIAAKIRAMKGGYDG